jgi:hypothetical protein
MQSGLGSRPSRGEDLRHLEVTSPTSAGRGAYLPFDFAWSADRARPNPPNPPFSSYLTPIIERDCTHVDNGSALFPSGG